MVIRKADADTDQLARSLLQKAVRRGNVTTTLATFRYLVAEKDEFNWLRSRLAVMTFEEAWPYGQDVTFGRSESEIAAHFVNLCQMVKNKDAAGLGSLGYALSQGDNTVLSGERTDWYIRVVAKALKERDRFFEWVTRESSILQPRHSKLVEQAIAGSKKAGWPWDKAFAYAAALLAVKDTVPSPINHKANVQQPFPFWTAIDKHTQEGKEAIRLVAKNSGIPANIALWVSFYCESARCVVLDPCPWWEREKRWRFSKLGLTEAEADSMWCKLQHGVIERLQPETEALGQRIMRFAEVGPEVRIGGSVQTEL